MTDQTEAGAFRARMDAVARWLVAGISPDARRKALAERDDIGFLMVLANHIACMPQGERRLEAGAVEAARARTTAFRRKTLDRAGGAFTREEVAAMFGVTPGCVDLKREANELLGVPTAGAIVFPRGQFVDGAPLEGMREIIAALGDMDSWGKLQLLTAPLDGFSDTPASVLELLAAGPDVDARDALVDLARGWAR